MRIAIDASRANKEQRTGVEWYSYHVIQELKKITPIGAEFVLYTNEKLRGDLGVMSGQWSERVLFWPPKYLWTQLRLWWELVVNPPEVLFVPAHTIPLLPLRAKTKVVVTVHDVGFRRFPELYKPIQVWYHEITMWRIIRRAATIITISEFSKQEIIDLYHVAPERITVSELGYDQSLYRAEPEAGDVVVRQHHQLAGSYLLYVGRIEHKKNIIRTLSAAIESLKRHPELQFVVAGVMGNAGKEVEQLIADSGVSDRIHLLGYVAEAEMPALLRGATALVFPTLYEGFGLPLVQAMACGTPVVTSDISPHRDIVGEAGLVVDPQDQTAIAGAMERLATDPNLRSQCRERGIERAQRYHWDETAARIATCLRG